MSNSPPGTFREFSHQFSAGLCSWFRMPASWVVLIAIDVCLITFSSAQESTSPPGIEAPINQVVEIEAPETANDGIRFEAVDVFIDSGTHPLAAWQLELQSQDDRVEIVGIEGGQHAAFAEPAYYDPRAMNGNRVILAAFSTSEELPRGKTRVARIHVQCEGRNVTTYKTSLIVAADADGRTIASTLSLARAINQNDASIE